MISLEIKEKPHSKERETDRKDVGTGKAREKPNEPRAEGFEGEERAPIHPMQ
jgi:hypothetical protein